MKGEICIVIAPPYDEPIIVENDEIENSITEALKENASSKAANIVAKKYDLKKEDIYARILKRK